MPITICPEPTTTEQAQYYKSLIDGDHGEIQTRHKELAKLIAKNKWSWSAVSHYINSHTKYDEWTFRDIDKACAFSAYALSLV